MPVLTYQRTVLLNTLVSRSSTRAREEKPPIHSARELLEILQARAAKNYAIEFLGKTDIEDDEARVASGLEYNFIRISKISFEGDSTNRYAVLLIEHVDQMQKGFPVVNMQTFEGREIEAEELERGACSIHVVIKLPDDGAYDDGSYRCAIETVPAGISRNLIEILLCRQLRRAGKVTPWEFSVDRKGKRGKPIKAKLLQYTPRLELFADVGQKLSEFTNMGGKFSHFIFTKRSEKQSLALETDIHHEDVLADIEIRVSGKQAPVDSEEKYGWIDRVKQFYEMRGFTSRLYYRHASGAQTSSDKQDDIADAADLIMCPKEVISLLSPPKRWRADFCPEVVSSLKSLVDRENLWQRGK
jgi:hypothetical protein